MEKLFDNCFTHDITPDSMKVRFISSYIIKGDRSFILVEEGAKSSLDKILNFLKMLDYNGEYLYIFVTHIHLDHAGSVASLLKRFESSIAYVHPRGVKHVINPERLWKSTYDALGYIAEIYGKPESAPPEKIKSTYDGEVLNIEGYRFKFIFTEGHASHHQSIYWEDYKAMFVGDSAGIYIPELNYIIPTTLYPVKLDLYIKSLKKMIEFKPEYLMYPHYGMVRDGYRRLNMHINQVIKWFEIAKDYINHDLNKYLEGLKEADEEFSKIFSRINKFPEIQLIMGLSLRGIYEEAKRLDKII